MFMYVRTFSPFSLGAVVVLIVW